MDEAQPAQPDGPRPALDVRFVGSGGDYFRIWIVNLLLTITTLGFYYPWAKVRRLRYFHTSTLVGGHALDFHGDPKKMLRGYLLAGAMVVLYSIAGEVSPVAGFIALVIVAGVFPALICAALRFRLANTSWRGLRLKFTGSMGGAYRAVLPFYAPIVLLLGIGALGANSAQPDPKLGVLVIVVLLLFYAMAPFFLWLFRKYQHGHYALGSEQTTFRTGPGPFYALSVKIFGMFLSVLLLSVPAAGLARAALDRGSRMVAIVLAILSYLALVVVVWPYYQSRMQNLLWSNTASAHLRFRSALSYGQLFGLTLKNMLLVIATLGFYWPYAAVAIATARLEAIGLEADVPPDELTASLQRNDDAAGDAAGDLLGIDIGF